MRMARAAVWGVVLGVLGACNYEHPKLSSNRNPITPGTQSGPPPSGEQGDKVTYARVYEEVLKPACFDCHGGKAKKKKLDVSDYKDMVARGIIVKGDPESSRLWDRIGDLEDMPPDNPLPSEQIQMIYDWIKAGAE